VWGLGSSKDPYICVIFYDVSVTNFDYNLHGLFNHATVGLQKINVCMGAMKFTYLGIMNFVFMVPWNLVVNMN
jgi:hypothetical protein